MAAQESLVKGANERRGAMLKKVEETKERIRELKMKEDVTTTKARLEAKLQKSDEALAGLAKDRAKKEAETEKQKKTLGESLAALSAETPAGGARGQEAVPGDDREVQGGSERGAGEAGHPRPGGVEAGRGGEGGGVPEVQ